MLPSTTLTAVLSIILISFAASASQAEDAVYTAKPLASIDLMTAEGAATVHADWRYSDVHIIETPFLNADAKGQPGDIANTAYDIEPKAGGRDFDDSGWPIIAPETLSQRRTAGRVSFNWYRTQITIPEQVDGFRTAGSTVLFEASVDDYAEVWVDGELPRRFPQSGGSVIRGWNDTNRLIVGRDVRPGQTIQLAVFGINGPISASPTNYIYMRKAKLRFHRGIVGPISVEPHEVNVEVVRNDPLIDEIVPKNPKVFRLAEGFEFIEGPLWTHSGDLLFSDPNANRIYRYSAKGRLTIERLNSGYIGEDIAIYHQPGSNGLAFDSHGRLTICEHGNRRVSQIDENGNLTVVADRFNGQRLNSPNDLIYHSSGALYFTDPPFGLPKVYDDPKKETSFSGVYRVVNGRVELLIDSLKGPNGIAFSPNEKYLYVGNWDTSHKVVMRYGVKSDSTLDNGEVFFDMTDAPGDVAIDGVKVDVKGNVYISGPGGIWIISAEGQHLGTIKAPKLAANMAWGGDDHKTLYLTARTTLYKIPLLISGVVPSPTPTE